MKQETIEEASIRAVKSGLFKDETLFIAGVKWQQGRSQSIVPFDAYDIEVFAIKPDEKGNLFAYIGYKISNGNFNFNIVPFTEIQKERMYSEKEMFAIIAEIFHTPKLRDGGWEDIFEWFEQFKNKNNGKS